MSDPFDRPLVSPVMVGREAQLAALQQCIDAASAGAGQTVLVSGDAGIGKSRLVAAAAAHARERGVRVVNGQCFAPDRTLPFGPWRDLVSRRLLHQPWAADIVADVAADLGGLIPELTYLVPASALDARGAAGEDCRRIVGALTRLVESLARHAPLLLIVEDAHWSDDASLEFLVAVARSIRGDPGQPVVLIVTYRADEITPPLAAMLAALARERLSSEAHLGPLPRAEVMAMLRALSDDRGTIGVDLAESIYRLSEGNPFFVEELLRSAMAHAARGQGHANEGSSGQLTPTIPLPRTITEAIAQRVRELDEETQRTLTLAAVSGRRFDFGLLQTLSGCDEERLIRQMKALISARLVVEESADCFVFRHALTRRAIDDGLLARERRSLHRQLLDAYLKAPLETRDYHAADLARHAYAAGAWVEALAFGHRAGRQALALYAPGAAVELLSLALDAALRLERTPPSSLHRERGHAYEALGSFDLARADFESAANLAHGEGNDNDEIEALLALGGLWVGRDYERAGPYIRQALDLARAHDDRALTARALNRLANWHANREEPAVAFHLHEEALSLAEALGDRLGIAESLDLIGMARYLAGDFAGSAAAYRRAIPLLRELDDRRTLVNALTALAFALSNLDSSVSMRAPGGHEERLALVREAVAVAGQIDGRAEEALAYCCSALIVGERHLDEALEYGQRGLQIAEEIGHRQWATLAHYLLGYLHRLLLNVEVASRHLDAALSLAQAIASPFWLREVLAELAMVKLFAGDPEGAEETIAEAVNDDTPMQTMDQREAWFSHANVALARGRPERALEIAGRLLRAATPDPAGDLARLPYLALLKGEALQALGETERSALALTAARDGALALELPTLLWRVHLARFVHARDRGQRGEVAEEIAAAHAAVQQIASGLSDPQIREAYMRRAGALLPPPRVPSPRQAEKAAFDGLTTRERQVAALVAAGSSNRDIGDTLFMSEHTAATHVGNILGKLGAKNRAQIAVWVQERGLANEREA